MLKVSNQEHIIHLHIERLPVGVYLATSNDLQGLVVQGRTVAETVEIARDVARKLLEAQTNLKSPKAKESFDLPIVVGG